MLRHTSEILRENKINLDGSCLNKVFNKLEESFKGIPDITEYRILDAKN